MKELRRVGLSAGDPVIVASGEGLRTVAACVAGGRDGGVLVTAGVLLSTGAAVGHSITLMPDFEALEAAEAEIEISEDLQRAWGDIGSGLQLGPYVKAVLDGALLFAGDVRDFSLNGRAWRIRVLSCHAAKKDGHDAEEHAASAAAAGPTLVDECTRLRVSVAAPRSTAKDGMSSAASAHAREASGGNDSCGPAAPMSGDAAGFSRIGGLRGVIDELREAVQLPLERPELYRQLGVSPPRGVLLYGPPGTGKTLLARSLGEELRCPVELLAATDLVGSGIGESEDRIKAAFDRCRRLAEGRNGGMLLFIDEIDAICPKRDDSSEAERRMVAALLTALDGAKGADGVVVLGATNRPDAIDPAIRRAGRLEREIEVGVPNTEERLQILEVHLRGLQHTLSAEDLRQLARRCHGFVGADLRALCMAAARTALRTSKDSMDLECCLEALPSVPPSALKELLVEVPEVRWADIGGYETTKEALKEAVEWPICHAWAFQAMRIDPPRGVLLYGPPGCSKTMMAKAVATETEMNFVSIKGPELFSKYVGDSERAVREVFRKARTAAPCVVFFDEVDAIGDSREGEEGGSGVAARVLAQLLAEMDGIGVVSARRHVVVLAATNRPHALDPALLRPGRFDRLVHVPLPDEPARKAIFRGQLARMRVSHDLDPQALASRTQGCSGAEAVMVCREAALLAIREAVDSDVSAHPREGLPCAQQAHFDRVLASTRPRIDAQTVRLYEDFERRMQHG